MAHTANPFDHSGTLDTSNYDAPLQSEAFGATGPATDSGQPTAAARTVVAPASAATICAALDQDADLSAVATARTAWITEVTPRFRESLAQ